MRQDKNKRLHRTPVSRSFHERLLSANKLDSRGFEEWIFHPAMLFGSLYKWWGDLDRRQSPHEGLDMFLYRTKEGSIHQVSAGTKIPVIFEGQVVKVSGDFLGESVFVSHDAHDSNGSRLYTVYGHIRPDHDIVPGKRLSEGDIIGVIADTRSSPMNIPSHLHISVAWIPHTMHISELGWQAMNQPNKVVLLDPLRVIHCPYSIVSDSTLAC